MSDDPFVHGRARLLWRDSEPVGEVMRLDATIYRAHVRIPLAPVVERELPVTWSGTLRVTDVGPELLAWFGITLRPYSRAWWRWLGRQMVREFRRCWRDAVRP